MLSKIHEHAQKEELEFWGDCANTFGEELKQLVYAKYMGLKFQHDGSTPYHLVLPDGLKILDVGGGPVSLLLKAPKDCARHVIDPCPYPDWVEERYEECDISYLQIPGEELLDEYEPSMFNEAWVYNVLQHVHEPELILKNIHAILEPKGTFRFFDWVDAPTNSAHPHSLDAFALEETMTKLGFETINSKILDINEGGCVGKAYTGWAIKES